MEKLFMTPDGIYTSPYAFNLRDIAPPHELSGGSQTNTEESLQHNKRVAIQIKEQGMVLVLVLVVLLAAIVIGITVMRSSTIEARIAGNERIYKQDFYVAESGIDYALVTSAIPMSSIGLTINGTYNYSSLGLPAILSGTGINLRLIKITNPPVGSGFSANDFKAHYYRVASSKTNQAIDVGAWKAFPK
ncbi:MAG: pilus assembly PilX N-terminal domain-containing protein [Thermodesulfobacteriota bacterium]|nr:pilus assembly PilX N-terminal domain-containing protein [Thermodesulfobacteriota bacterium]